MSNNPNESHGGEHTQSTLTGAVTHRRGEMAIAAASSRAKAEVEARFVIAYNRPRNFLEVRRKVLEACQRPGFAEAARYRKPVGGNNTVDGFSIRFAEEAVRALGNISVEAPVIWEDDERRTVRITVTDLETNTSYSKDVSLAKTVERRNIKPGQTVIRSRENSVGQTVFIVECTEDEMAIKVAAAESKIIRNAGLRLMPSDILDEAEAAVEQTLRKGGVDPQAELKKIVDAFSGLHIKPTELEKYLAHSLDTVNKKELADLRGVFTAIREGDASWQDYVGGTKVEEPPVTRARSPRAKAETAQQPTPTGPGTPTPSAPSESTPVSRSNPAPKAPTAKPPEEKLAELRAKMVEANVTEAEVLAELRALSILDESLSLDDAVQVQPTSVSTALNGWRTVLKAIEDRRAL